MLYYCSSGVSVPPYMMRFRAYSSAKLFSCAFKKQAVSDMTAHTSQDGGLKLPSVLKPFLHPPENCSCFHLSAVNRTSLCLFPTVPASDRRSLLDPPGSVFFYLPISAICQPAQLNYAAMPLTLKEKACRVIVSDLSLFNFPLLSVSSLSQHPLLQ